MSTHDDDLDLTDDERANLERGQRAAAARTALMEAGFDEEQAEFLVAIDELCEGRDATVVVPLVLMNMENVTVNVFTPEAMRQVAGLFSEAAMRIGQKAAEIEEIQRAQHNAQVENAKKAEAPQIHVVQQLPRHLQ